LNGGNEPGAPVPPGADSGRSHGLGRDAANGASGRGSGIVGYNVQIAVDAEHHLIVAHEVTNVGHDRTQLEPMAHQAHELAGAGLQSEVDDRDHRRSTAHPGDAGLIALLDHSQAPINSAQKPPSHPAWTQSCRSCGTVS
jgi:hypothetical protein